MHETEIDHYVKERRTIEIDDIDVDHGRATLYRVERDGSRNFNGYDTHFIVHFVDETRYGHEGMTFATPHEKRRCYIWLADENGDPIKLAEKHDGCSPSMERVARRFARDQ